MFLPLAVEARQKFLDMGCNVDPSIRESEKEVLWLDGVRFENHTVAGGGRFPFPCAGKIEVSVSRQAQGIAEQGGQQERGCWAPYVGPYHVFERVMRARLHVTGRYQPGAVLLKEFCELQGTSHCRPPSPQSWPWQIITQLFWMGRPGSCWPFRAHSTQGRGSVPTREMFRAVQHAPGVHKLSVGARID